MFTIKAELLISVASLVLMFVVLWCVVKMYFAVMADNERRQDFPGRLPSSGNRGPWSDGEEASRAKR